MNKVFQIISNQQDNSYSLEISKFDTTHRLLNSSQQQEQEWFKHYTMFTQKKTLLSPQSDVSLRQCEFNSRFDLDLEEQNIIPQTEQQKCSPLTGDKNSGKNLCRALKSYIFSNFSVSQRQIGPLKRFLALKSKQCGRIRLLSFLKTHEGNQIGQHFFGNYHWGRFFIETSKIDITQIIGCVHTQQDIYSKQDS